MYLGGLSQSLQRGYDNLKSLMKQSPMETVHSINQGLKSGSLKKALINAVAHTTVKYATGNNYDKAAVAGNVTGELLQLGVAGGDIAKAGEVSKISETIKFAEEGAGAVRAAKFSSQWSDVSLNSAIQKYAPGSEGVIERQKTLYYNSKTGIQVVYDNSGNYFRIENIALSGKRKYLDMNGNIPNNKLINGKQAGRTQALNIIK